MKRIYIALSFVLLIVFQLLDYLFFVIGLAQINSKFVFGYLGGNTLASIMAIILLGLLYIFIPRNKLAIFVFCLLVAGTMSNIIDRLVYGGVVDYIKISFIPVFNLADIAIVVSIVIIFWQIIKKSH